MTDPGQITFDHNILEQYCGRCSHNCEKCVKSPEHVRREINRIGKQLEQEMRMRIRDTMNIMGRDLIILRNGSIISYTATTANIRGEPVRLATEPGPGLLGRIMNRIRDMFYRFRRRIGR